MTSWIDADRLLAPDSAELTALLELEREANGHVSEHATALTMLAVYAMQVAEQPVRRLVEHGVVLDASAAGTQVLPGHHGLEDVRFAGERPGDVADLVAALLDEHLLPLADALEQRTRAGLRQLRGAVAFGCASGYSRATRDLEVETVGSAYDAFMGVAPDDFGTLGELVRVEHRLVYLRSTCCLTYTATGEEGGQLCASCVLTPREERIEAYRAALTR